ncbi:hig-anchoring scaffold protein isoform X2 [Musca autumnalis]|uniref:hig-anchoring scaffold protein isoform X2 n=1 Tax=Musca autumnalis TaxID=221902 RepID=UPI003CE7AC21
MNRILLHILIFTLLAYIVIAVPLAQTEVPQDDEDDDWDEDESSEADDDSRIYKNPRNSPSSECPRDEEQATLLGQKCLRKCSSDEDCKSKKKKCLCDGVCGMSCIKPDRECPELAQPSLGQVTLTGRHFGQRASYSCPHGYHVVGLQSRLCQADGNWAGAEPACKQNIYCLKPPKIEHARNSALPDQETFDLDSTVQYHCHNGYVTNGFPRAKCLAIDGQASWYGPDIQCEPRSCGQPPDPANGWHSGECYTFGCKITYNCGVGYELVGKHERTCQSDGSWTPKELPTCVLVTSVVCPTPENPKNGKATFTTLAYNSVVSYECRYGYTLVGESSSRCGADRKWSGTLPICKEINCGHPGVLYNGWIENVEAGTGLGASIIFRCQPDMLMKGSSSSVCQIDGRWRNPLPECLAPCVVPAISQGVVVPIEIITDENGTTIITPTNHSSQHHPSGSVDKVKHGTALDVQCEKNYEFPVSLLSPPKCHNGTWSIIPRCVPARCKNMPKPPKHGMVLAPKTEHGMKARFKCKDGFKLVSPEGKDVTDPNDYVLTCSFGNWTGEFPHCQEVFCSFPGYIPNGKVLLVGNMGLYDYRPYVKKIVNNKQIMYDCDKGYVLDVGPPGATCVGGKWRPLELPQCLLGQHPRLRWNRRRRSIEMRHLRSSFLLKNARTLERKLREVLDNYIIGLNDTNVQAPCLVPSVENGKYYKVEPHTIELSDKPSLTPLSTYEEIQSNEFITLVCEEGYKIQGAAQLRCGHGSWSVNAFSKCVSVACTLPNIPGLIYEGGYRAGLTIGQDSSVNARCNYSTNTLPIEMTCNKGTIKPQNIQCESGMRKSRQEIVKIVEPLNESKEKISSTNVLDTSEMEESYNSTDDQNTTEETKMCGPPTLTDGALIYKNGDIDIEGVYESGTEIYFNCIPSASGERNTWKIICENGEWIGRSYNCANGTCLFKNNEPNVVSFYNDLEIREDVVEFPPGATITSRCTDIGKFELVGSIERTCIHSEWTGVKPQCFGLNQENDYAMEKAPTILFRRHNGPIAQSNDGKLIVYPGTTLHMECLWMRRFGNPKWSVSHDYKNYSEGWVTEEGRDPTLEYRLTIVDAQTDDSGIYSCETPARHKHSVEVVVKSINCPEIPTRRGLIVSTNETKLSVRVLLSCSNGNSLIGSSELFCLPSGNWSAPLPVCESVECGDIPLPNNITSPRVSVLSREVGGRAAFSCPSGYGLRGPSESICMPSGEWATPFPTCVEVQCENPGAPQNGYAQGTPPYRAGDVVQFNCNPEYMMQGQPIIACQDNGRWSGGLPKCVQACSYPGTAISGHMSSVQFYYAIGESITFTCDAGLELRGPKMVKCLKNGKWSGAIPQCVALD